MKHALAIVLLAACETAPPKQAPSTPPTVPAKPPAAAPADAATVTAEPPFEPPVLKTEANDDLRHRRAQLGPLLVGAAACIPKHDDLSVAIDVFAGTLVACAQAETREGGMPFIDRVSFACWDVDPATAKLAKRSDLARAYFRCQDGCEGDLAYGHGAVAYDGKTMVRWDDDESHPLEIYERRADGTRGARRAAFQPPGDAGKQLALRGAVFAGGLFVTDDDDGYVAVDDAGHVVAKLPRGDVRVLDDTHLVSVADKQATILDTTARTTRTVTLGRAFTSGPVNLGAAAYAIDGRTLAILDPRTFKIRRTLPLATCK